MDSEFDRTALDVLRSVGDGILIPAAFAWIEMTSVTLDELGAAIAAGDHEELRRKSHSLKGSSMQLGAIRVAQLAFQLQTLGAQERSREAATVFADLVAAHGRAAAWLRSEEPRLEDPK